MGKTRLASLAFLIFSAVSGAAAPAECDFSPPRYSHLELIALKQFQSCVEKESALSWPSTRTPGVAQKISAVDHQLKNREAECLDVQPGTPAGKYCDSLAQLVEGCQGKSTFQPFPQGRALNCSELERKYAPDFAKLRGLQRRLAAAQKFDERLRLKIDRRCQKRYPRGASIQHGECRRWARK